MFRLRSAIFLVKSLAADELNESSLLLFKWVVYVNTSTHQYPTHRDIEIGFVDY